MAIGPLYRPIAELLRELGADVDAVLAQHGLTFRQLVAAETRLSPDQGRALGRTMLQALPREVDRTGLGLRAAERFATADADLLGYIMNHSADPLAAARALAEHARLLGDSADFRVEVADDAVTITLGLLGGTQFLPLAAEFAAGVIYRMLRDCSQGTARPLEVRLARPALRNRRTYERFFAARVLFDAPVTTLIYPRACMSAAFSQSDRRLVALLTAHARDRLQTLAPSDLSQRARACVADGLLSGDTTLEQVAFRCGLSARTLRRRLTEAGTSYRALLDDVRKERAIHLLEAELSISHVAQHLGFSDATAFARAFRRWTGRAPHEHVVQRS